VTAATATPATAPAKAAISLANLKHALRVTGLANSKASLIPVLQGVHMQQIDDGLALEATDLDIHIRVIMPELGGPAEPLITPAKKFNDWAKLLTGEDVKISATESRATVQCGRAKAVLPLMPPDSWPMRPVIEGEAVTLTQGVLARALRFTLLTVSDDQSRMTLTGIKLEGDGNTLRLISTNGTCLMLYSAPFTEKINLLIPGRMAEVLIALMAKETANVDAVFDEKAILATIDAEIKTEVAHKLITGGYPNWPAVMPKKNTTSVKVSVPELLASLERCAILSDEKSGAIDLKFNAGEIALHSADQAHGEADETVPCEGGPATELHTRINSDFLKALLRKLDGEITIALPEVAGNALLFKAQPHEGETLDYVVMPMRV
jgi:DNA polymerase III subunit beta